MMTFVTMRIVRYFSKMGISIMNHADVWGNLFVLNLLEGRIQALLDLIKVIKTKPHCEIPVHCMLSFISVHCNRSWVYLFLYWVIRLLP